jgi:FlaA1/EpsC-like NDP-sugar epimerase
MDQSLVLDIPRRWLARNPVVLRNRYFFVLDLLFLIISPILALILRLDGTERLLEFRSSLLAFIILTILLAPPIFYRFGLYGRFWRYASVEELVQIVVAVGAASAVTSGIFFFLRIPDLFGSFEINPISDFIAALTMLPRSIPFISALLLLIMVGGSRYTLRVAAWVGHTRPNEQAKRVAIVGAGDAGSMIARELQRNPELGMKAIAFIDDDVRKHGMKIHRIPVVGSLHDLTHHLDDNHVEQVIIAMPTATGKAIREIVDVCEKAHVSTKTIPGIYELIDGTVRVEQLRNVEIEDLLRRETVKLDPTRVQKLINGRRVLITGGGGSIGSELCRQVLQCNPSELIILGHGENSIYEITLQLDQLLKSTKSRISIRPVIADIRFRDRIQYIFEEFRPEIVFHAAAHKHVPLMEANPSEAITNNILGTRNLLELAMSVGTQTFVMISSDKAVNPTSIMGATKRVSEQLVHQASEHTGANYITVRFGNVLGSRGSVVPRFKEQIALGGPVTVTHPEVERFFMTIPESVQLVLQTAAIGQGGEIFVLDMGEPIKIVDLATDLIKLSGLEVGQDIDVVFTNMRPGEKLSEELFSNSEGSRHTTLEKVLIANGKDEKAPKELQGQVDKLEIAAHRDDREAMITHLQNLVPEFKPEEKHFFQGGITPGAI